ncbi:hypothetical protein [Erythrobacter sp. KY5]|uniref:hypothetical protein n=1 Tax=Erythrobacter sp. KY5 TaxID=2011159 RepID=UPI0013A6F546|nr:hypothetical protein [Erythrobacter sp. KY5]
MVERAVDNALEHIDGFIEGAKLNALPDGATRAALDGQLAHTSGSVRLASLFFAFYATVDAEWDCNSIPTGIRGKYGDKRFATELGLRSITIHKAVTAFGENLGWKGNVSNARLQDDVRFDAFARRLAALDSEQRNRSAEYMAAKFSESRKVIAPLPPVGDDVLTYARARKLFYSLIAIPSEGNVQQFLIAALLFVHRQRYGYEIKTHHVHASDRFDTTAGDIEEMLNGDLIRAYEVTVRPDWKNRVGDFRKKMDTAGLRKYTIIASDVNSDDDLAEPADLIRFLKPYGRDIAVVDIHDFVNVFAMELSADELRRAVTQTYSYLTTPSLCGRDDIVERFNGAVEGWLDEAN